MNTAHVKSKTSSIVLAFVKPMLCALIAIILMTVSGFHVVTVYGASMDTTLESGEKIIVTNFLYTPKRVKSNPKFKIRNMFLSKKKVYKKDKTFKTQIDFNLLDASNRFMLSGSNTTKFQIIY